MTDSTLLVNKTILRLSESSDVRAWRNNTGVAWMGKPDRVTHPGMVHVNKGDVVIRQARRVTFGLPGSGDIIGIRSVTITAEHVGARMGQFISVECKAGSGRQNEQQEKFEKVVTKLGGVYILARSPDDVAGIK